MFNLNDGNVSVITVSSKQIKSKIPEKDSPIKPAKGLGQLPQ
jgi:hypothetical protein